LFHELWALIHEFQLICDWCTQVGHLFLP